MKEEQEELIAAVDTLNNVIWDNEGEDCVSEVSYTISTGWYGASIIIGSDSATIEFSIFNSESSDRAWISDHVQEPIINTMRREIKEIYKLLESLKPLFK